MTSSLRRPAPARAAAFSPRRRPAARPGSIARRNVPPGSEFGSAGAEGRCSGGISVAEDREIGRGAAQESTERVHRNPGRAARPHRKRQRHPPRWNPADLVPEPPAEGPESREAQAGPRMVHGPDAKPFQALRAKMETEWTPQMMEILGIGRRSQPIIWDADFLYGPQTASGEDSHLLCEINVSSRFAIPYEGPACIARLVCASGYCIRGHHKGRMDPSNGK
jgi:hypothetical protein